MNTKPENPLALLPTGQPEADGYSHNFRASDPEEYRNGLDALAHEIFGSSYGDLAEYDQSSVEMEYAHPGSVIPTRTELG